MVLPWSKNCKPFTRFSVSDRDGVVQITAAAPASMDANEVGTLLRRWFAGERLEVREQQDPRADVHLAVKYPPGPRGHTFTVVVPKGRDLVAVSSVTRVDAGQQDEMSTLMGEEEEEWKAWVHEMRMHLITSGVDWNLSMGHDGKARPGPLQAFNVSLPVWFDGLTKNEIMQSLRTLWMSKLGLIHEIKFGFGQGVGRPGPVDDWEERKRKRGNDASRPSVAEETAEIQILDDDAAPFGNDFDPSEWI